MTSVLCIRPEVPRRNSRSRWVSLSLPGPTWSSELNTSLTGLLAQIKAVWDWYFPDNSHPSASSHLPCAMTDDPRFPPTLSSIASKPEESCRKTSLYSVFSRCYISEVDVLNTMRFVPRAAAVTTSIQRWKPSFASTTTCAGSRVTALQSPAFSNQGRNYWPLLVSTLHTT